MKIKMAFGLTSETIVGNIIGLRLVLHRLLKRERKEYLSGGNVGALSPGNQMESLTMCLAINYLIK